MASASRFSALAAIALLAAAQLCAAQTPSQQLETLAAEAYERGLDLFPFSETLGKGAGTRQDRVELTFTAEHRERQRAHDRWILAELGKIPASALTPSEKLTHEILAYRARNALEWLSLPGHYHYIFIQLDGGVPTNLIRLAERQPLRHEADYRAWFTRVARLPQYLDGAADVMREGIAAGITTPRPIVERALGQLESLAPPREEMEKSALWKPMTRFPESLPAGTRARLEAEYRKLLADEMFPALRKLAAFVRNEYLPHARTSDGIGAIPGGEKMYRLSVRWETTTGMTPDEIHALGLKEVARITERFLEAGRRAGFEGPMAKFGLWLRGKPENYPFATAEDVIAYLNAIHARIVPQLPRLFGRFPKAPFEIRLTEPALAASMPASYYPPSDDGTRPGIFSMPVVNAKTISTFGLAALLAHEGMPGHHFDGGIRLENKVPEFRRRMWVTAFGEGWALYAESLGHELGLYEDPLQLMGRYQGELFRACRLVVDTGLHAQGWPRERAIQYLVQNCAASPQGATLEVVRYMAWPGQALSYKIGELRIMAIREKAQQRLGARFDVRAFHDALLAEGHLPLSLLEARMETWIGEQAR